MPELPRLPDLGKFGIDMDKALEFARQRPQCHGHSPPDRRSRYGRESLIAEFIPVDTTLEKRDMIDDLPAAAALPPCEAGALYPCGGCCP